MDFVALLIFLGLYYLRPQEWFASFNSLRPVQLLSFLAVFAMARSKKLNPRDLVRTPLDWLVLSYFLWTLIAGWQFTRTLGEIEAVLLFYFVAVRTLDTIPHQKTFLAWWCAFVMIIAALAIASMYGFDPLGSNDFTQGVMKGRLILNLTIFDNPNALAHSVIPAVPLIYFLLFWRRVFMKAGLLLLGIPLYCMLLTQSKGAFLSGFATLLATLTFGRAKMSQLFILLLAVGVGYGALYSLPRMTELNHAKNDPAIQGRVAAFTFGLKLMRENFFGVGLGNFKDLFWHEGPLERLRNAEIVPAHNVIGNEGALHRVAAKRKVTFTDVHYMKAPHSAYNENGAELGYVGLFLFIGILYCCVRTLLLMKTGNNDEERIRRALFAMVIAYATSSWMVDFCYRPSFFMFVAAISGLHRYFLDKEAKAPGAVEEVPVTPRQPWLRRLPPFRLPGVNLPGLSAPIPAGSAASLPLEMPETSLASAPVFKPVPVIESGATRAPRGGRILPWQTPKSAAEPLPWRMFLPNRLGIKDYLIMVALTYIAIRYWQHLISTM
jgi:hypothetical protein